MYFVDDPYNPEWKVVIQKEPRSRRVTSLEVENSLSPSGRTHATRELLRPELPNEGTVPDPPAPIREADVEHVMAHEESDEEPGYEDIDCNDDDGLDFESEAVMVLDMRPIPNVLDDL